MIEQNIYTLLSTSVLITPLIGTRVYPLEIPQDPTLPALCYSFVGGSSTNTLTTTGIAKWRLQVDCYGDTYADAVTLRNAVVQTLNGYYDATMNVMLITPRDFFDHELLQYRATAEFYVLFAL
jgi:hypothetical protein